MPQAIVDSHIHFWDPARLTYPWHSDAPTIAHPYLPTDLDAAANSGEKRVALQGIIFLEADCLPEQRVAEVEWITELAEREPRIQAIVASAALEAGPEAMHTYLEALQLYPLVKGIRRLIQGEGPGFCIQPAFVEAVQLLPAYGFSFDICIRHYQMEDAIRLVDQCPGVSFVLDHFGKPAVKETQLDPWRNYLRVLASFPNVQAKLSGLATEADHQQWTREQLRPYIDHTIACFGVDRVFYGGDWPVSTQAIEYTEWIDVLLWATADLTDEDRHKIFVTNARSFYRID
jgi:L-fuconolactonase